MRAPLLLEKKSLAALYWSFHEHVRNKKPFSESNSSLSNFSLSFLSLCMNLASISG